MRLVQNPNLAVLASPQKWVVFFQILSQCVYCKRKENEFRVRVMHIDLSANIYFINSLIRLDLHHDTIHHNRVQHSQPTLQRP